MSQADSVSGSRKPSRTVSEQALVSDFQHLGLAVRADENDTAQRDIGGAAIAARVAYARHANDDGDVVRQVSQPRSDISNASPVTYSPSHASSVISRRPVNADDNASATSPATYSPTTSPAVSRRPVNANDNAASTSPIASRHLADTDNSAPTAATGADGTKRLQHKSDYTNLREARSIDGQHDTQSSHVHGQAMHADPTSKPLPQLPVEDMSYRDPISELPKNPDSKETVMAKPVVHETIHRQHHEIRQEVIEREIHEYHEVTKILPVVDTVILPARHFIETADGGKVEIPEPKAGGHGSIEYVKSTETFIPDSNDVTVPRSLA